MWGVALAGFGSFLGGALGASPLINTMKHDIFVVTGANFDAQVEGNRKDGVVSVLYYANNEASKALIDGEYNKFAAEFRGMIKVAGLNCDDWGKFCEKQGVTDFPSVVVYPPNPFPAIPYKGEMTSKALASASVRHIPTAHVKKLNAEEKDMFDAFLATNIAVPKVILFSSKETAPILYNALANSFHDRMSFGFISQSAKELVDRFSVKSFPTLLLFKGEMGKNNKGEMYKGEMKFMPLHEWLNVRSETFVRGGGFSSADTVEEIKPWLIQKVPEVTKASHQDVCFRHHQALCVIWISPKGAPSAEEMAMIEALVEKQRNMAGPKFIFSWLDASVEQNLSKLINFDGDKPGVVVFNPKRLRYMKAEGEGSEATINTVIEKISGGDARFTVVKEKKLPPFAAREVTKDEKKDEL